ncbi:MAG: helix-turn-helix domain-containing protein [Verrucomicrobiota bacterium]|nr:helix-turn-helix domain-containing protein [Verrucomicrobiota bacterium]
MPTVAEQLRAAREAKKLSIQRAAELTKIRTDHLRALEEGNFNLFSAPIYIRGSVKNYATTLKMEVTRVMAALEAELKGTEKFSEPPPLVEQSKSRLDHLMFWLSKVDARVTTAAVCVLAVVLLFAFARALLRHRYDGKAPPNLRPEMYQSADSDQTLPLPRP